ncbi:MAG TPA: tetratricopeptide repeat protein, partial [Desulfobacterales bacterium]|nr:tetratricopeptide repeat protein [Desulfobacterales bacterium]
MAKTTYQGKISRIVSIKTHRSQDQTTVAITGDGNVSGYTIKTLKRPPRILVDFKCTSRMLGARSINVDNPDISSIRIGYHFDKIRVVIDIRGDVVPSYKDSFKNDTLIVSLQLKNSQTEKKQEPIRPSQGAKLVEMVDNDRKEDTALYLKCLKAYRSKDWEQAVHNFTSFIKNYPNGRYAEKAYFILAQSYDHFNSKNIPAHYKEIRDRYEDAISRFPDSEFIPDAMYSIGTLLFKMKNYSEAMGYYNLVIKEDKGSLLQVKALIQKVKILILKKRRLEALTNINQLVQITSKYPDLPERTEARKEKAKILYEMNKFYESIEILQQLIREKPEYLYVYPEISLYLGYDYYQLGNNKRARENLYRFYNICPDRKINNLVLNQIGDTYRNEGSIKDAVK